MISSLVLIVLGIAGVCGLLVFVLSALREREVRAARVAMVLAAVVALLTVASLLLSPAARMLVIGVITAGALGVVILFLLPIGQVQSGQDSPTGRYDERDIMFARARLEKGSADYRDYYAMRPEYQAGDDRTRALPGLLSPEASHADPLVFAATDASFGLTSALRNSVDGPISSVRRNVDPEAMTRFVKAIARYYGAHSVGVTELRPHHVYSHVGRGSGGYGTPIDVEHRYAVAYTVEMDRGMVGTAPLAPTVLESARQYVEAGTIGVQLANLLRELGHAARAHIDGNYRVIAPLVARDAGLGGIGRMGLLMTPTLGPRVRIGIVTTDLPLIPDPRDDETAIIDFCRFCEKCADNCPVRAIPTGDRVECDGALRWRINAEVCYRYWCVVGTDCGRCMDVCPFSYPDSLLHNIVRRGVRRSGAARRAAYWMDRVFFGSNPPQKRPPSWLAHSGGDGDVRSAGGAGLR
jgi:ferredoxin